MSAVHDGTRVRRVRLVAAPADPGSLRLWGGKLIGGLALAPPGLAPSAVLVVRRLADPRPGTLALDAGECVPMAWEQAVNRSLAALARGAARPAHGPVPAGARAVLFADRAELLACLARAARRGELSTHWWWTALNLVSAEGVARAWIEAPAEVPGGLALLDEVEEADGFLDWLGEAVETLYERVAAWHGLPAAAEPRGVAPQHAEPGRPDRPPAGVESVERAAAVFAAALLALARKHGRAVEPPGPAVARGASAPTHTATQHPPEALTCAAATGLARAGAGPGPDASPVPTVAARDVPRQRAASAPAAEDTAASEPANGTPPPLVRFIDREPDRAEPVTAAMQEGPLAGVAPEPAVARPTPRPVTGSRARRAFPDPPAGPGATVTCTRLGGLFYLLDAALALELYGDFTTPLSPGIDLDPWDFVALLGAHLLSEPVPEDPVWPLLAQLAGRPAGRPAGHGLAAPRRWRLPAGWLAPFAAESLEVIRPRGGRFALGHSAGFTVVDVPRRGPPGAQRARELRRRPPPLASGPVRRGDPLERWVGWVGGYLRARIGAALDAPDPATLSARLLEHRAEIHVTPTHVDVVLSLAELPLEVRIAGLDRTPGWIPAARRHVAFHFE